MADPGKMFVCCLESREAVRQGKTPSRRGEKGEAEEKERKDNEKGKETKGDIRK